MGTVTAMKIKLNENMPALPERYLFSEVEGRVDAAIAEGREKENELISLGIGDATIPVSPSVAEAMSACALSMSDESGFVGYQSAQGLTELREAISSYYLSHGVRISADEIFVSDGAKSDLAHICNILGDNTVCICDPVYPVYFDSSAMLGRRIKLLKTSERDCFLPSLSGLSGNEPLVIYLCSPNNPTGAAFTRRQLAEWVDFAERSGSLIIFDAAYEAFVTEEDVARSVYEIDGAKRCAVEICSFSKMSGFTGIRCGWCTVPMELCVGNTSISELWYRYKSTTSNGVSYISQIGALSALSENGLRDSRAAVRSYMQGAKLIGNALKSRGLHFTGGVNAPYLWVKCPMGVGSWEFFEILLERAQIISTAGVGFGSCGEGYIRLSAFAKEENIKIAAQRIKKLEF